MPKKKSKNKTINIEINNDVEYFLEREAKKRKKSIEEVTKDILIEWVDMKDNESFE